MFSRIITNLAEKPSWILISTGVIISEIMTLIIAVVSSYIFRGFLAPDYLITGMIASGIVSLSVLLFIVAMFSRLKKTEKTLDSVGREKEEVLTRDNYIFQKSQKMANLGSFEWNLITRELKWSDELYDIYGIAKDTEISYESFLELVHSEDREEVKSRIEKACKEKKSFRMEERVLRPDGSIRILDTAGDVILNDRGEPVSMLGICHDITERRTGMDSIKEREVTTRQIVDSAYDAFIGIDENGLIIDWNKQAEVTFGWKRQEILGKPLADTIIPANYREAHLKGLANFLKTGEGPVLNKRLQLSAIHSKGFEFPIELTIWPTKEAGKHRFNAFLQDITERKIAEENVSRLASIVESSNDGIMTISLEGTITTWNKGMESIYEYRPEEIIGRHITTLAAENLHDEIKSIMERMKKGERISNYETKRKRKDGTIVDVSVSMSPIFDNAGKVIGMSSMVRDITERKKVQDEIKRLNDELERRVVERTMQLEESNKELESFSYSVSHDLRAPLRGIDGFSKALAEDYGDKLDEQAKDYLFRVREATKRMDQLISDLLRLSMVTRREMNRSDVNLSLMANTIAASIKRREPKRSAEFRIIPDVKAHADPNLINIVLENLFENAWKFSREKKKAVIDFGSERLNGKTVYYVRDNGVGFSSAHTEKLFQPFHRLHSSSEFEGTGIGLATVARIIRRHGGTVWAEGKLSEGAVFYFTLT